LQCVISFYHSFSFFSTFVSAQSRIQFWIVDELDKPLPGAHVFVNQFVLLSNDSGFVAFDRISDTLYIKVQYVGYQSESFIISKNEFPPKRVKLKSEAQALRLVEVESHRDVLHMSLAHEVANKRFLEENNDGTLANTLSRLPGVQAISLGVGIAKPVIRGLSFNRVLFANQGIKQDGQQWGADHGIEIDQFDVEEVDVIKGPATLLYGSDAMGGIINVLPR
jgi:iron complex outermembrane recepter protein